ncbi:MAG: thiamine pyrophosphate-dependent enzyme [Fimbriimonadaceae bacterium]
MRAVETELLALSSAGQLRASLPLAQGQEALLTGADAALRKDDSVTATYRGHGYVLAKGGPLLPIIAEILGKAAGLSGASLSGGQGNLVGASVGALVMATINMGCNTVGLSNWVQEILTGVIILVAVAVDRLRARQMSVTG